MIEYIYKCGCRRPDWKFMTYRGKDGRAHGGSRKACPEHGKFIKFNSLVGAQDVADTRGLEFVRHAISNLLALLGVTSGDEAMRRVEGLMQGVGLETDVRKVGLTGSEEAELLIRSVNRERLRNNPRRVEPRDIPGIIGAA